MIDLLANLVVLLLIVELLCAYALVLTVLPFVLTVDMAERRGFSPDRWGAVAVGGIALAAGAGHFLSRISLWWLAPVVVLTWLGPAVLALMSGSNLGGRAGAHQ